MANFVKISPFINKLKSHKCVCVCTCTHSMAIS